MSLIRGRARSRPSTPTAASGHSEFPRDQQQSPFLAVPSSLQSMAKVLKRIGLSVRPSTNNLRITDITERPLPELPHSHSHHPQVQTEQHEQHLHLHQSDSLSLKPIELPPHKQQHAPEFLVLPIAPASFERRRTPSIAAMAAVAGPTTTRHSPSLTGGDGSSIRNSNSTDGAERREREQLRSRSSSSLSSGNARSRRSSEDASARRQRHGRADLQVYGWTEEEAAHANQMYVEFIEEKRKEASSSP